MKAKSLCCLYDKNISTGRKSEYNSEEYNTKVVFIDLLSLQDIQLYNDISSIHPVLDLKSYIYTYKYIKLKERIKCIGNIWYMQYK